jgi:peptidase E
MLFFPLTDTFMNLTNNNIIISSAGSAIISTTVMQPFDLLKTKQLSGINKLYSYNIMDYYKGLSLNLFRVVPHFMITMSCIELLKNTTS